jgi:hypothetical protein
MIAMLYLLTANYKRGIELLAIVGITVVLLLGYCKQIEAKTGVFTVSSVQCDNEYVIAYNIGELTPEHVSDPTIRQRVIDFEKKNYRKNIWDSPSVGDLPLRQRVVEIQRIKSRDIFGWYSEILIDNLKRSCRGAYNGYAHTKAYFPIVYLLIFLTGVTIACDWYRKRECPIIPLFLWLMCTGNIMVNLLGSYAEWIRLFLPSTPMLIMLLAAICELFRIKCSPSKIVEK